MKFICIGGICLGAIILKHIKDENYKELKTPINNVSLNGGFLNSHKLFDGTFEKEILGETPNVVHKILEGNKFPSQWFSETYTFPHTDFNKEDTLQKLRQRFNTLKEFIKSPDDDYWFLYSLHKSDVNLTEDEIKGQLNILSKYIDVSRIIFLGGERYEGLKSTLCGYNVANNKFKNRNENFRKVVGDRYFIVSPSNVYDLAALDFVDQFEKFNHSNSGSILS